MCGSASLESRKKIVLVVDPMPDAASVLVHQAVLLMIIFWPISIDYTKILIWTFQFHPLTSFFLEVPLSVQYILVVYSFWKVSGTFIAILTALPLFP